MRIASRARASLALIALAGCTYGMPPASLREDLGPGGARLRVWIVGATVRGTLWTNGSWLEGELIALDDRALYLLVRAPKGPDAVLAEVDLGAVSRLEVRDPPVSGLKGPPTPALLSELRPTSRHPQGLSTALTAELLASLGRTEPTRIRP